MCNRWICWLVGWFGKVIELTTQCAMHWTRRYLFGKALFKKSNCEGLEWLLPFWHNSLSWICRTEMLCFVRCWSVENDGKKKRTTLRHDTTLTNSRYAAPRRNRSQIYKFSRNFWLVLHTERKRERRVNISMKIAGKNERERARDFGFESLIYSILRTYTYYTHRMPCEYSHAIKKKVSASSSGLLVLLYGVSWFDLWNQYIRQMAYNTALSICHAILQHRECGK